MRAATVLRWTGRVWGVASAALLAAFAFGGRENLQFTLATAAAFALFPVGVIVGFAVAWWRELVGGLVSVGSLALFYLYMLVISGRWVGPYFLLFAAPGFLHVAAALLAARRGRGGLPPNP